MFLLQKLINRQTESRVILAAKTYVFGCSSSFVRMFSKTLLSAFALADEELLSLLEPPVLSLGLPPALGRFLPMDV